MQRFCDRCRQIHELSAFDLDNDEVVTVCRPIAHKPSTEAGDRHARRSKIEVLEQQRRGLIVALVNIDHEIAKERDLLAAPPMFRGCAVDEVFGTDADHDPGD